jgi:hypothetical protein
VLLRLQTQEELAQRLIPGWIRLSSVLLLLLALLMMIVAVPLQGAARVDGLCLPSQSWSKQCHQCVDCVKYRAQVLVAPAILNLQVLQVLLLTHPHTAGHGAEQMPNSN